jgi:hypothetical protein
LAALAHSFYPTSGEERLTGEPEDSRLVELAGLLDEIEALAPTREQVARSRVVYRRADEDVIDDSLPEEELPEETEVERREGEPAPEIQEAPFSEFRSGNPGPLAAVDCGIVRLGQTENGLVIALRSTIVVEEEREAGITLFRTGPIYLHNQHKASILEQVGRHLGRADFFVDLEENESGELRAVRVKSAVADDAHQYGDRFRNWLERLAQRIAVTKIQNGVVLLDGALTLRTRDTPRVFLDELATLAAERSNALVAISKQSMLQVQGRPIPFWLNDVPNRPGYRLLTHLMRREGAERVLGNAYAVRFSPLGPTFRMDVKAVEGQSDEEAINRAYSSCLMRGGYPDILVRAHVHSYFTPPDVFQLQAEAAAKYQLTPQPEVELTGIFAPFGGRYK